MIIIVQISKALLDLGLAAVSLTLSWHDNCVCQESPENGVDARVGGVAARVRKRYMYIKVGVLVGLWWVVVRGEW